MTFLHKHPIISYCIAASALVLIWVAWERTGPHLQDQHVSSIDEDYTVQTAKATKDCVNRRGQDRCNTPEDLTPFRNRLVSAGVDKSDHDIWLGPDDPGYQAALKSQPARRSGDNEPSDPASSANPLRGPTDNRTVVVHPYDLLKNPFQHENELITMDVWGLPQLVNGGLYEYNNYGGHAPVSLGLTGLRFNRMLARSVCLYDMMAMPERGDSQVAGQLIVRVNSGTQPTIDHPWLVQPIGTLAGTNGFGAAIDIPAVIFRGYGGVITRECDNGDCR